MPNNFKNSLSRSLALLFISLLVAYSAGWTKATNPLAEKIQGGWKDIGEQVLMGYVNELCSEKYAGRLTGTKGFNDAAEWVAEHLAQWGLKPGGDNGTYFQEFPNSYTLVLPGAELVLHQPP